MISFAIHNQGIVINIICAESRQVAESIFGTNVLEITNLPVGMDWFLENDTWYAPRVFDSWIWNLQTQQWEAPTPMPLNQKTITNPNGKLFEWSEAITSWIEIT